MNKDGNCNHGDGTQAKGRSLCKKKHDERSKVSNDKVQTTTRQKEKPTARRKKRRTKHPKRKGCRNDDGAAITTYTEDQYPNRTTKSDMTGTAVEHYCAAENNVPASSSSSSSSVSSLSPKRKKRKRRRNKGSAGNDATFTNNNDNNTPNNSRPLNGLTLAISTHDKTTAAAAAAATTTSISFTNQEKHENSYNAIASLCRAAGAKVTGQVHKRVHAVICTPSAISQLTQRVRKGLKRRVPLIHVRWVKDCVAKQVRVELDHHDDDGESSSSLYLLNNLASQTTGRLNAIKNDDDDDDDGGESEEERHDSDNIDHVGKERKRSQRHEKKKDDVDFDEALVPRSNRNNDSGWSDPITLGCCCVCHENVGYTNCSWCVNCY